MVKELIGKLTADKTAASSLGDLIMRKSVTFFQVLHRSKLFICLIARRTRLGCVQRLK